MIAEYSDNTNNFKLCIWFFSPFWLF